MTTRLLSPVDAVPEGEWRWKFSKPSAFRVPKTIQARRRPTSALTPAMIANVSTQLSPADFRRSIDALRRYLAGGRPKLDCILKTFGKPLLKVSLLSEATAEDLKAIPSMPFTALTPDQLIRFAQVVYTASLKSYLLTTPDLLGSLCRIENWYEVLDVEALLREREKFSKLILMYNGKMHAQALDLVKQYVLCLSQIKTDVRAKLQPTVTYLQNSGEEYIDQVFKYAMWLFQKDQNIAFEISQSEDVELPRPKVADFLETIDPRICARFIGRTECIGDGDLALDNLSSEGTSSLSRSDDQI